MDAERQKKFESSIDTAGAEFTKLGASESDHKELMDRLIFAVVGFDKKKPDASEEDAGKFVGKIVTNLTSTYNRRQAHLSDKHSAQSRAIRKTQIEAISSEHGIKFTYLRETFRFVWPPIPVDDEEQDVAGQLPSPIKEEVEYGDKVGTVAFKYHLDHKNQIFVELAFSFCSPKDRFDNLDGKEEALKHFMEGKTLKLEASHGALSGSLLGPLTPVAIEYAEKVLKANGVVRRLKEDWKIFDLR